MDLHTRLNDAINARGALDAFQTSWDTTDDAIRKVSELLWRVAPLAEGSPGHDRWLRQLIDINRWMEDEDVAEPLKLAHLDNVYRFVRVLERDQDAIIEQLRYDIAQHTGNAWWSPILSAAA